MLRVEQAEVNIHPPAEAAEPLAMTERRAPGEPPACRRRRTALAPRRRRLVDGEPVASRALLFSLPRLGSSGGRSGFAMSVLAGSHEGALAEL
jgi:hypothetical protein